MLHLWCRLAPLAVTTLNLLRPSRINPKLLLYEILKRVFDYNKTSLVPPGCKVVVGIAPDHYQCHRVYVPKTRAERIAQTVNFFPHNCKVPQNTLGDVAAAAAHRLFTALQNPAPNAPLSENHKSTAVTLERLANIFLKK